LSGGTVNPNSMPWPFKRAKRFSQGTKIPGLDFFDLHSHVLPGLDDGASDFDESIAMLDGLAALGCKCVASTPHFDIAALSPDKSEQENLIAEISSRRQGRPPRVITGAEVIFGDLFLIEEEKGNVPRIGESRLYVVEFHFNQGSVPSNAEDGFFRFQVKGGALILAHPERIPDLQKDSARMRAMRNAGAFLQVDLLSLSGKYGDLAKKTALDLIEEGAVDIVSSDLHSADDLEGLGRALDQLAKWNLSDLVRLASTNPKLLLAGRAEETR
jgi:protein-tyrosine phosphatase